MVFPKILKGKDMPKHLAVTCLRIPGWCSKNNKSLKEGSQKGVQKIKDLIDIQTRKDIPILSLMLSSNTSEESSALTELFEELSRNEKVHDKKIRISVIGDWFDEEGTIVEQVKKLMEKTRDYDNYFLNLLVNYDGQKEVVVATRLLLKKIKSGELSIEDVDSDVLKENLPTSNFLAPELIIENDSKYNGAYLFNSVGSKIYFTNKFWLDFERTDLDKALDQVSKLQ